MNNWWPQAVQLLSRSLRQLLDDPDRSAAARVAVMVHGSGVIKTLCRASAFPPSAFATPKSRDGEFAVVN